MSASANGDNMSLTLADVPQKFSAFIAEFQVVKVLGSGADGVVTSYQNKRSKKFVAVKTPKYSASEISKEIKNLKMVGPHDHITSMLTFCKDFKPETQTRSVPAVILELCDLGDVNRYRKLVCDQLKAKGKPQRIPEATILKLLRDMSLALDHLHNKLGTAYVHGDLKNDNILVVTPPDYTGEDYPSEPIFKLADFARLVPHPTPPHTQPQSFHGTIQFAPPYAECIGPLHPSADIWMLGATIWQRATDVCALEGWSTFNRRRQQQGLTPLGSDDREERPTMYRPLHVTADELIKSWSIDEDQQCLFRNWRPYGAVLDVWCRQLFDTNHKLRIHATHLVKYVVPWIDLRLPIVRKYEEAEECFAKAARIKAEVKARQDARENEAAIQAKLQPVDG
jgi:serine/threonine protein kinase